MLWNLFYHSGECRKGSRNFCPRFSHFAAHKNRLNFYQMKASSERHGVIQDLVITQEKSWEGQNKLYCFLYC